MNPLRKIANFIGSQPWVATAGPRIVKFDTTVQRLTAGRIALTRFAGLTSVLLTTTGRNSGLPRQSPLLATPDGGSFVLVASNFGRQGHPAWSANLIANPQAAVHTRGHTFPVTATLLAGDDRAQAWHSAVAVWPAYDLYAARVDREIRVFRLTLR